MFREADQCFLCPGGGSLCKIVASLAFIFAIEEADSLSRGAHIRFALERADSLLQIACSTFALEALNPSLPLKDLIPFL